MSTQQLVQIQPARQKNLDLLESFPFDRYTRPLKNQLIAFEQIQENNGNITIQMPTGSGKTCVGYTFLKALYEKGKRRLVYIVPNKTLVNQIKKLHPDVNVAYGRNEHPCLYYPDKPAADTIPCSLLVDCPHRVDQKTGKTKEPGAVPCPYLQQKYEARNPEKFLVCTFSFYLYTGPAFSEEFPQPEGLVIDEVHKLAQIVRSTLSYDITDHHLENCSALLYEVGAKQEAEIIDFFRIEVVKIAKKRELNKPTILQDYEIEKLLDTLHLLNRSVLKSKVKEAIKSRQLDGIEKREILKKLEVIVRDLNRYLKSLEYSLPRGKYQPSTFAYAYYNREMGENDLVQTRLVIKAYAVAPIIRRLLSKRTLSMSATIGDPDVFGFDTGIKAPFYSIESEFPAKNTRIFLPCDMPNLSAKYRPKGEPNKTLRRIVETCKKLNRRGIRCMIVVVSEKERRKTMQLCESEKVDGVSYGNGVTAKAAAESFKNGQGSTLVGTTSNYGEGIDLPGKQAQMIFFLRPGYASPDDPLTQFEERRFGGGQAWAVRNWRAMQEALQVRGRNVRSPRDKGITIFVSEQFKRFLFHALPDWLKVAYVDDIDFDTAIKQSIKLLS